MRTQKQVLAEFQQMQKQMICDGFVEVSVYQDGNYWAIKLVRTTITGRYKIDARDWVEWTHYTCHDEEYEAENEKNLAEFKEKFNLK